MKFILLSLILFNTTSYSNQHLIITDSERNITQLQMSDYKLPLLEENWINLHKLNELTARISEKVYQPPVNARIDDKERIIPARPGQQLNKRLFQEMFHNSFYTSQPKTIVAPLLAVYPKVDAELLSTIKEKQIGQYHTYFNSRNQERSHNIELATEAIDNHVIFPGETFSFNAVVGKRTKEKGYLKAPVIIKGELSEDIGGGICQVSSTLFNAIDQAGATIVQRYSHSRSVPYVPSGRDATVSWYGPDFTFRNNFNQPVLIRAETRHGKVTIRIFSSEAVNNQAREIPRV